MWQRTFFKLKKGTYHRRIHTSKSSLSWKIVGGIVGCSTLAAGLYNFVEVKEDNTIGIYSGLKDLFGIGTQNEDNIHYKEQEIQDKIQDAKDRAQDVQDKAHDKILEVKDKIQDKAQGTQNKIQDVKDKTQDKIQDVKDMIQEKIIDKSQNRIQEVQDKAHDKILEVKDKIQDKAQGTQDKIQDVKDKTQEKIQDVKDEIYEIKDKAHEVKERVKEEIETNPRINSIESQTKDVLEVLINKQSSVDTNKKEKKENDNNINNEIGKDRLYKSQKEMEEMLREVQQKLKTLETKISSKDSTEKKVSDEDLLNDIPHQILVESEKIYAKHLEKEREIELQFLEDINKLHVDCKNDVKLMEQEYKNFIERNYQTYLKNIESLSVSLEELYSHKLEEYMQKQDEKLIEQISQLKRENDSTREKTLQDLFPLQKSSIESIGVVKGSLETEQKALNTLIKLVAYHDFEKAISEDSRSFKQEHNTVKNLVKGNPILISALDSIPPIYFENGVKSLETLQKQFLELSSKKKSEGITSIFDDFLKKPPQGLVPGNDTASVLSRAAYHLSRGSLLATIEELNELQASEKIVFDKWIEDAQARQAVNHAKLVLQTYVNNEVGEILKKNNNKWK